MASLGEHLRSLVKDDDIELKFGRFQILADRERTHHQTWLESNESIRHTSEKLSQRQVSLLLVDFGGVARLDPPVKIDAGLRSGGTPQPQERS